ncbi:MmpS family transport accessory protein [Streptomyces sp. NPDC058953]|uniref:MmpS family transport accessory protein n=1 Tax=unclassified Streptomyces TaxID=2593676 RepID=UPI0036C4BEF4
MRRSLRHTTIAVTATAGLVFGLTACSEAEEAVKDRATDAVDKTVNKEYEVTYEVTGKNIDSVKFANGQGSATAPTMETVDKPKLPWTKTVTLRGIMPPTLIPTALDVTAAAEITCKVTYKDKVIAEQKSQGAAAISPCIAVSPIASEKLP